jgi:hypothetical protein
MELTPVDVRFLKNSLDRVSIGGAIDLPSGTHIDPPPAGYHWYIQDGKITAVRYEEE